MRFRARRRSGVHTSKPTSDRRFEHVPGPGSATRGARWIRSYKLTPKHPALGSPGAPPKTRLVDLNSERCVNARCVLDLGLGCWRPSRRQTGLSPGAFESPASRAGGEPTHGAATYGYTGGRSDGYSDYVPVAQQGPPLGAPATTDYITTPLHPPCVWGHRSHDCPLETPTLTHPNSP
jgi:hypothetical protein